jgi:hypothetical protein
LGPSVSHRGSPCLLAPARGREHGEEIRQVIAVLVWLEEALRAFARAHSRRGALHRQQVNA